MATHTRAALGLLAVLLAAATLPAGKAPPERLRGFSLKASEAQRRLEETFKAIPSTERLRDHHRWLTREPHPAGSEANNKLAREIAQRWQEYGLDEVRIHRYDVLNSAAREVVVEMVSPTRYRAALREDAYEVDPDTRHPDISSAYLSLSASGEVTAPLVYAHSGNPEDYDYLKKRGIDVRGKVALVRYSEPYSYRGFKALTAQQRGVAALLIYSDPAEDGYRRGAVFPDGPWGPESHLQRGAITYDFIGPGDPLTPGWASVESARRIPVEEAQSVPRILAVPLAWRDAKPLLEQLDGPAAPKAWQGGLPLKYRLGGGRVQVHVKVDMDTRVQPNYVVEGRLRGGELPDEWVVMGSHHDAWVFGGVDASSGSAALMELARALGELKKQGLRPRRTLVLCSWDGEEVALTTSTEWGEQFADELKEKAVAYINVDPGVSGPEFEVTAVPSLAPLVVEVSRSLDEPSGKTLYNAWKESAARERKKQKPIADSELVNTRVGSGSDHTVFLNYLGRPVVLPGFTGPYGVYHSAYDDFYWMNKFGDPGYRYHRLLTQFWGVLALRLANAETLPFDFVSYAENAREFVQELERKKNRRRQVDLKPLLRRVDEWEQAAQQLHQAMDESLQRGSLSREQAARLNRQLMQVEANWLAPEGIPGRPWFKHLLYGTRFTYAHLELPALTEAVERGDWKAAQAEAKRLEEALLRNTALLNQAAAELGSKK
ncbi:MAG TPA: M28 family metallopeptidase [Candidatus Xenobia bacterium]|nr:M28 family metallopeptidase [Candidatus Xenobia bacterium]